ncbi:MAG TPA: transporter substrate-binding domain-containing protein [Solimonas sp.]|nr:transporter substrate-binding domain-containing protein [Solimonas sp.]
MKHPTRRSSARGLLLLAAAAVWLAPSAAGAADQALWEKSTLSQILKRGELRIGLEAGYMPFEMRDKRGQIIGFDVDLAKKMASVLKVKMTLVNTQWDGIIPALLTDKFDVLMGGMTVTSERNVQVTFIDPYITIGQTALLARKLVGKVRDYKELNAPGYVIATKLGTSGDIAATRIFPKARIAKFESEADAALEVRNGRADAFIYDLPFNAVYANRYKDGVGHLATPFTHEDLAWAIRKGDPDFENWLNNFLQTIRNDGTYDLLYQRWFEGTDWLKNLEE